MPFENNLGDAGRRQFLRKLSGLAALAAVTPALLPMRAFAKEAEMVIKGPPVKDIPATQISGHVWVIISPDGFANPQNQGMMSNITFVLTKEGVVVLDSGASLQIGEMALRQLKKITDKPVIAVINSHYHGDHWLGNHAFVNAYPDIPIYAHPKTIAAIRQGGQGDHWKNLMERATDNASIGTIVTAPNKEVDHGSELKFGDVTLRIHHYGTAHTPADICMEVVEDQVVHVGDVAMDRRIAFMEDGSYLGTFKTFDALEKNVPGSLWLPGHGEPGPDVIKHNRELFDGIFQSCVQAVKEMKSFEEAKSMVLADPRVKKWAPVTKGFNENIGSYTSLAYLEAEQSAF